MEGKRIIYTWDDFDSDCENLRRKLLPLEPYSIFGIKRGGLVVAIRLSHLSGMPFVDHVKNDTVIVDDICQTGRTFDAVTHFLGPGFDYKASAALWVVKEEYARPTYWIRIKSTNTWVQFPWETKESSKYDMTIPNVRVDEVSDYLSPEELKERGFDKIMKEEL
jgi:hypoxanthine phosphoribosyltransferase